MNRRRPFASLSILALSVTLAACGLTADQLRGLGDGGGAIDDTQSPDDNLNPVDVPPGTDAPLNRDVHVGTDVPVASDVPTTCSGSCDDSNPCTDDSCVGTTCMHANNTGACDDGNVCNGLDMCGGGSCSVHAGLNCDDSNPCTTDACGASGCTHANVTGACPGGTCMGGTCMSTATACGGGTAEMGPPDYTRETSGAVPAGASSVQQMAIVRANHWRTSAGIAALNGNAHLDTSATNHSNFCSSNPQASCWPGAHDETSTCAGFTGHWPWDRMTAAGYSWSAASEDMNFVGDPISAVDGWIWTPYHRHPFMDPSYVDTGYGQTGSIDVMDFGSSGARATAPPVSVFPVPGQTGVLSSFNGAESPTPPAPPTGFPSGTVISISLNADGAITEHLLWDAACAPVAHTYSASDGSGGTSTRYFFFYANRPLATNAQYTARVSGTVGSTSFSRTWIFQTGAR